MFAEDPDFFASADSGSRYPELHRRWTLIFILQEIISGIFRTRGFMGLLETETFAV